MSNTFTLCPDCLAKYDALRYDPECTHTLDIVPLGSLVWPDEHPEEWYRNCCVGCRETIQRLVSARTSLWREREIPQCYRAFWAEAQQAIPHWPGFQRLTLSDDKMTSLRGCAEEMDDLMSAIHEDFPKVTFTDRGGGLSEFSATRREPSRRWWQFWK